MKTLRLMLLLLLVSLLSISTSTIGSDYKFPLKVAGADSTKAVVKGNDDILSLSNGYVYLEINLSYPLIQTIRFDPTGQGSYGRDICMNGYPPSWNETTKGLFSEIINNTDNGGQGRELFRSNLAGFPGYTGERSWSIVQNGSNAEVKIYDVGYSNGERLIADSTWDITLNQGQSNFSWVITDVKALNNIRRVSQQIEALITHNYTFCNGFNISMIVPDNMTQYFPSYETPFIFQSPIDWDWKQISLYGNDAPFGLTIAVNSSWGSLTNRLSYFGLSRNSTGSGRRSTTPILDVYANVAPSSGLTSWTSHSYNRGENLPSQKYVFYLYNRNDIFFPFPSFNQRTVYMTPNSTINQALAVAYYVNLIHNLYQPGKLSTDLFDRYNQYGWKPDVWAQMHGILPFGSSQYRTEYARQISLLLDSMDGEGLLPEYFNMTNDQPTLGSYHKDKGFDPNLITIFTVRDYLAWTENMTWLNQNIGRIRKVWNFLNQNVKEGLLYANFFGSADWDDWANKSGYVGLPNMQFYRACLDMGDFEAMAGNISGRTYYYNYANDLKKKINKTFWNGTFYLSWIDINGIKRPYFHAPTNQLAIFYGIANSSQADQIWNWTDTNPCKNKLGTFSFYPELGISDQLTPGSYDNGAYSLMNTVFWTYIKSLSTTDRHEEAFNWLWNFTYSFADPRNPLVVNDRGAYIYEWYDRSGSRQDEKGFAENAGDYLASISEEIFGVQPTLWNLRINPHPPAAWVGKTYNITGLNFRETLFNVTIRVEGTTGIVDFTIDGRRINSDGTVPSQFIDGNKHAITITVGDADRTYPYLTSSNFELASSNYSSTNRHLEIVTSGPRTANASLEIYIPPGIYPNDAPTINCNATLWNWSWKPSTRTLTVSFTLQSSASVSLDPLYKLAIRTIDSKGYPLNGATVNIYNKTLLVASGTTNSTGYYKPVLLNSSYTLKVRWQSILVNQTTVNLQSNTSIILTGQVYYATINVQDTSDRDLFGSVYFTFPNGTHRILSGPTIILNQIPIGNYSWACKWEGTWVSNNISRYIDNNITSIPLACKVYSFSGNFTDANGNNLPPQKTKIYVDYSNGTTKSYTGNSFTFHQVQNGTHYVYVEFEGSWVYGKKAQSLTTNTALGNITTKVYELDVTFKDNNGTWTLPPKPSEYQLKAPNGTINTLAFSTVFKAQNGTWEIISVKWEGTNVVPDPHPKFNPVDGNPTFNCRVYKISFSKSFKDSAGQSLYKLPTSFKVKFPNATISTSLNPSLTYMIQNGTTSWYSIIWQGTEVSPSMSFDATNGAPSVSCQVFDLTIEVKDYLGFAIPGVHVRILWLNGTLLAHDITGSEGKATFIQLPKSDYKIEGEYLGLISTVGIFLTNTSSQEVRVALSYPLFEIMGLAIILVLLLYKLKKKR